MNPIAIYSGSTVLYWSSVIIVFGLLACLMLSLSLQRVNGGSSTAMLLFFPLAIILSVPICRVIHWYCHFEQYNGIWGALTDYSTGSYCLPGALLGVWLAALIVKKLGFERSIARLLDAFAPGAALAVAFIRLSALFNSSCRSKIAVTTPALQHLPIASGVTNSTGAVEARQQRRQPRKVLPAALQRDRAAAGQHPQRLQLHEVQRLCQHRADDLRDMHRRTAHLLQPPERKGQRPRRKALGHMGGVVRRPCRDRRVRIPRPAARQLVPRLLRGHDGMLRADGRSGIPDVPELLRRSSDRRFRMTPRNRDVHHSKNETA